MNPMDFLKIRAGLINFSQNHPKFFPFMRAVAAAGAKEGTVVEMKVTTPEGKELETNLKLSAEDLELIHMIRELGSGFQKTAGQEPPADTQNAEPDGEEGGN